MNTFFPSRHTDVETGRSAISSCAIAYRAVATLDGKYLAFLSNRAFDPVYDAHHWDLGFLPGVRPYLVPLLATTPSPFAPEPRAVILSSTPPSGWRCRRWISARLPLRPPPDQPISRSLRSIRSAMQSREPPLAREGQQRIGPSICWSAR